MINGQSQYLGRETEMHFYSQKTKGDFYGIAFKVQTAEIADKIKKELQSKIETDIQRIDDLIFFSGPMNEKMINRIKKYASKQTDLINAKIVKGTYENFAGNPAHWLKTHTGIIIDEFYYTKNLS